MVMVDRPMTVTITPRDLVGILIGGAIGAVGLLWLGAVIVGIGIGLTATKIVARKTVLEGMAARLRPMEPEPPAVRKSRAGPKQLRVVK